MQKFTFENGCVIVVGDIDANTFHANELSLEQIASLALEHIESGKIDNVPAFGEVIYNYNQTKEVYFGNDATIVLPFNICVNDYREALTILIKK